MQQLTPCLWFDTEGEEAANFYVSVFKNSRIVSVSRYGEGGPRPAGTAIMASFELNGQPFSVLNAGPESTFTEAISIQVPCDSQDEVDDYWSQLCEGGEEGRCGWLKDKYGVSWQVFPTELGDWLGNPDPGKSSRAMQAMMQMSKIDIVAIREAAEQS